MKDPQTKVTIAKSCTQNWDEMEKKAGFSFCNSCSKNVIDFTGYSNAEIISVLTTSVSTVCGRLSETQLNQLNYYLLVKPVNRNWMKYLGVLAIGMSVFTQSTNASVLPLATEISIVKGNEKNADKPLVVNKVTGRILGPNKKPVAGIRLVILNTPYYAMTDQNGQYEIILKNGLNIKNNKLSVQSARYSATIIINYTKVKQNDFILKDEPMIMGEIMIQTPKKS
ncbi:hypothetical protein GJU39_04010 [Pedobacter petrophilus]|uniref:Uncharacterized protein n=1 Tax=Pedobacter petrophilus TaxID=1908241 RepID=A0A7K0FVX5_9SPHI|nr:carboxypeptidase-like regulatory domain-containing protein [Pedobacter petrophilus]MRX75244.1 hypothetical protein [Pedobacter petrophilus]